MLKNLRIRNYALIEDLDISFDAGFSVITGETGAGKSILLGALSLILGSRADTSAISAGAARCTVEAVFDVAGLGVEDFFDRNELDYEDECIIRRELTSAGKSRSFINDTPVQLTLVRELCSQLIDIHSQHQNLLLNNAKFMLDVVDSVADNDALAKDYAAQYKAFRNSEKELEALRTRINDESASTDFMQFQLKELSSANLEDGEQERLEEEQLILNNAENIKDAVFGAGNDISSSLDQVRSAQNALERIGEVYSPAARLAERLDSCRIELDDIQSELSRGQQDVDFDPERAEAVGERLNTIYALMKKYHRQSVADLLALQADLESRLHDITDSAEVLDEKQKECDRLKQKATEVARQLSTRRSAAAGKIEQALVVQLQSLGMPDVRFEVKLEPTSQLDATGMDQVTFLFSSNKNVPPCSISKIASGGEVARVMLSLKALLSAHKSLPTIVFDEIDTGVSGKISDKMASVMEGMAKSGRQVVCITHQPQIAAAGQHHYRVYKESGDGQAHTHIERLDPQARVEEIAKMLSGEKLTDAAINNAKILLKR
jgi:DNA repair protein RecN (Recombination protein N)